MRTVCPAELCTGCRLCEAKCPVSAVRVTETLDAVSAAIDENACIGCGLCESLCPCLTPVPKTEPIAWYEGWSNDPALRAGSSSGGVAAALTRAFIRSGGYVCSCRPEKGRFVFAVTNSEDEARRFAGSKYVKSDMTGAYEAVDALLARGEKVLFIGLPCQSAALGNAIPEAERKALTRVDLICHGTPSHPLLRAYLAQRKTDPEAIDRLTFRDKYHMGLAFGPTPDGSRVIDRYTFSFLNGLTYTDGCYRCRYASADRVSDLTLGDSWGTDRREELGRGLSLVLCQTEKGRALLESADLTLFPADAEKAIAGNGQLTAPSRAPAERQAFFDALKHGKRYDRLVFRLYPRNCLRQTVKKWTVSTGLYALKARIRNKKP